MARHTFGDRRGAVVRIQLQDHGSIWLAQPLDQDARAWICHSAPETAQYFGHALVIEPRYVSGFADAAQEAGAEVEVV
jgi:hypothetical protein